MVCYVWCDVCSVWCDVSCDMCISFLSKLKYIAGVRPIGRQLLNVQICKAEGCVGGGVWCILII